MENYNCCSLHEHSSSSNSPPPTKKLKGLAAVLTQIEKKTTLDTASVTVSDKLNLEVSFYLDIPKRMLSP